MADERELAREILSGQVTLEEAGKERAEGEKRNIGGTAMAQRRGPATAAPVVTPGMVPVKKEPVVTGAPEAGRKFPCKNCGARLDFDPTERALKCPYCGHVEEIAPAKGAVQEHDFQAALSKIEKDSGTIAGRSSEVKCPGCGATVLLEDNVQTQECPFCAAPLENVPRTKAAEMICPESLLPFRVTQRQSIEAFNGWIKARWFAPNDLKQFANLGQLSGVYLPYWTYDSMTYSHYTGQRGDDYWDTETYTTTENGKTVTRTRQVLKTRWTYVSGEVDHFFDDVLVCASRSLPGKDVGQLEPWDLQDLQGFDAAYLAGFKTERYVVALGDGFTIAQQIMAPQIRQLITRDIGGDHQSINSLNTQDVGVTYKHILLPLWLAVYRYQNRAYRILVNARTGEVCGERPYSAIKIALAVLLAILAVVAIYLAVSMSQQH
jgi:rubrerythrin